MEVQPREIQNYLKEDGISPFEEWIESLRDLKGKAKIRKRLQQVRLGNLGDYRAVGGGVFEFRINFGPGYRVYFGQVGSIIVLIICGGDKSTQDRDISKAQEYWRDYERRENTNQ